MFTIANRGGSRQIHARAGISKATKTPRPKLAQPIRPRKTCRVRGFVGPMIVVRKRKTSDGALAVVRRVGSATEHRVDPALLRYYR